MFGILKARQAKPVLSSTPLTPKRDILSFDNAVFIPQALAEDAATTAGFDGYYFDIKQVMHLPHRDDVPKIPETWHPYAERLTICVMRQPDHVTFHDALAADIKHAIAACDAACQQQDPEQIMATGRHLIRLDTLRDIVRHGVLAMPSRTLQDIWDSTPYLTYKGLFKPGILYISRPRTHGR